MAVYTARHRLEHAEFFCWLELDSVSGSRPFCFSTGSDMMRRKQLRKNMVGWVFSWNDDDDDDDDDDAMSGRLWDSKINITFFSEQWSLNRQTQRLSFKFMLSKNSSNKSNLSKHVGWIIASLSNYGIPPQMSLFQEIVWCILSRTWSNWPQKQKHEIWWKVIHPSKFM